MNCVKDDQKKDEFDAAQAHARRGWSRAGRGPGETQPREEFGDEGSACDEGARESGIER